MKKRMGIMLLCAVMLLTGCAGYDPTTVYDNNRRIAGQSNTYNKVNYKQSQKDNTYKISCELFEGMDTIWNYNASEDMEIQMEYTLAVESGKAKLVLISPDGEVETITEVTNENEVNDSVEVTLQLEEGENRIKLVGGADTSVDLEMIFSE